MAALVVEVEAVAVAGVSVLIILYTRYVVRVCDHNTSQMSFRSATIPMGNQSI